MQLRERERPEISLAIDSIHGHLCDCSASRTVHSLQGKPDVVPSGSGPLKPAGSAAGHLVICLAPLPGLQPNRSSASELRVILG